MLKQWISAVTAVCCFAGQAAAVQAAASDAETAKFYYTQNGAELKVSLNGSLNKENRAADALLAVYDGEMLINTTVIRMDEDISSLSMGDLTITLPYAAEDVTVKSFLWAADGSCEPLGSASELSDVPGDAYEWYGIVTATSRMNSGLAPDEAMFTVYGDETEPYTLEINTGNTDLGDRVFEYVKISVLHDDDSNEYTAVSCEPVLEEQTVSFPAAFVSLDGGDLTVQGENGAERYSLSEDVLFCVNGTDAGYLDNNSYEEYILGNMIGSVKLIDAADPEEPADGIYDYVMVSYYAEAVVDSTVYSSSLSRIYFSASDMAISQSRMEWDPEDEFMDVSFTKDGSAFDPAEIMEYDVLSIAYDVTSGFRDSAFYDVKVSRNIVHGTVENVDTDAGTVTIGGKDYPILNNIIDISRVEPGSDVSLFINSQGYAVYFTEGSVDPATPDPGNRTPEPSNEFVFSGASTNMYVSSVNGVNTVNGSIKLNCGGEPKQLSASVELIENGSAAYTKNMEIPAGSETLDLNGKALPYEGLPESAVLSVKDGDTVLYTSVLPVTSAEDIYLVRGRVSDVPHNDPWLAADEVKFRIEKADDFAGSGPIGINGDTSLEITCRSANKSSNDMLFIYSEAYITKESDGSHTLISAMPCSGSQTASFSARSFASYDQGRLYVYRSESSGATTSYRLSYDVHLFVNGADMGPMTEELAYTYLDNDKNSGVVTLIDMTQTASTANDGYYDYIFVDYCLDAVVDRVDTEENTIYFKTADPDIPQAKLSLSPESDYVKTEILLDGAEIDISELKEYDVVSIACNTTGSFADSSFYELKVSRATASGCVSVIDPNTDTVTLGGTDYAVSYLYSVSDLEPGKHYTLYLDVFDRIAYFEEVSIADYGVITAMSPPSDTEYPTVRLLAADGSETEHEVTDQTEADKFWNAATGSELGYSNGSVTENDIIQYGIQNTVVEYSLSSDNKISLVTAIAPEGGADNVYNAQDRTLGSYRLGDYTKLLNVSGYISGEASAAYAVTADSLSDSAEYTAYFYNMDGYNGQYGFILITDGLGNIQPDTQIAVVSAYPSMISSDGITYMSIPVLTNGTEDTVLYNGSGEFYEGDIIIYSLNVSGTADNIVKVIDMSSYSSYSDLRAAVLDLTSFSDMIEDAAMGEGENEWAWQPDSGECKAYFGPIYRKNGNDLELITNASEVDIDGNSCIATNIDSGDQIMWFPLYDDVKTYIYDYCNRANTGERVYTGYMSSLSNSIYNPVIVYDNNAEYIVWKCDDASAMGSVIAEDIRPNYAFVKTVDSDVTEVVYFMAD